LDHRPSHAELRSPVHREGFLGEYGDERALELLASLYKEQKKGDRRRSHVPWPFSAGAITMGTQISRAMPGMEPRNSLGATPMIVNSCRFDAKRPSENGANRSQPIAGADLWKRMHQHGVDPPENGSVGSYA
jgi:hypothetical protein